MRTPGLQPVRRALSGAGPRVALAILVALVIVALGASVIAPYDPIAQPNITSGHNLPPSFAHPFGTDGYSRDVLSRVIAGAQTSLAIAAISVTLALLLGTAVGAIAGYAGGAIDRWLMRGVDTLLSIPRLLLLMGIVAALGQPGKWGLALILGCTGWLGLSRLVRGEVRQVAALDYVAAVRALGVRDARILIHHILPAVVPQILVAATLAVASVIPLEAGLSFLGLGVRPPEPTWGSILYEGFSQQWAAWWLIVFPGAAILLTMLAANVLGERLRDALDPRLAEEG